MFWTQRNSGGTNKFGGELPPNTPHDYGPGDAVDRKSLFAERPSSFCPLPATQPHLCISYLSISQWKLGSSCCSCDG